ncbi:pre-mRNA-processing ATP-dependent RNA helicase-like protein PRP5 [Mollisia scopiformis]|uniref:RNA helicase n=1 Tax=Mollisia scopiformis TaxID=149040 RepID=A0A194XK79_MOLSC|nr:pre-mRNA-processing ATP-dependent RNA helicase-like protein PRP5 [Mollisia scopiformis]KUJ20615.1 pre-mRNA-processing ATP-dependent RNA helicase-like protein PRP5 [Mollisia scopiformis]
MARHRDSRSPSPAGSQHSSKRVKREDDGRRDRDWRDDPRGSRRRSRSRSVDRRHRERDAPRRRDRSVDRREDDYYRSGRRDRSRDRRDRFDRERERSPDRRRRRSRDREYRDRRDDSYDRAPRRREDSTDSWSRSRGDGDTRKSSNKSDVAKPSETAKQSASAAQIEADKKAERLAKLEAWKKKMAEDKERKEKELAAGGTRKLLEEIDQKANGSPSLGSPASPAAVASPQPYAGKFDPKAIAKKAVANSSSANTLGTDLPLEELTKASATLPSSVKGLQADKKPTAFNSSSKVSALPKARGNLSAFGLGGKPAADPDKSTSKRTLDFGEDEGSRKKLEKLPTLPLAKTVDEDAALANGVEEEDDGDVDMEDAGTEEEAAAAARAAAEKREERLQEEKKIAEDLVEAPQETNGDTKMKEQATPQVEPTAMEEDDDIDPLDAFMDEMGDPFAAPKAKTFNKSKGKNLQQEPEPLFGDDDVDLKALDADPDDILAMASKARKKKELPTINYAKLDLEPFRKNFYSEPAELADMSEAELADLRLELDGIKVAGKSVPKPVQKWSQCGLNVQSLEVIRKLGYERPTAIQMQAIPSIMSGRDVIGVAKTGSGKTIAFLLPMFRHIRDQRPLEGSDGPISLIMTPTRELATQIHKECKPFLKAMNLRAVCAYGGAPIKDQIADLKRGAEIIVCTPGRMIDLLAANSGRVTNLRRVTYVVLDEADRMFDMGFEPQVMKIFANIRPNRQTILFSATMPRIMDALAKKTLQDPVEITVGGRSIVAPEITQIVEVREEKDKFHRLLELLGELYDKDEDARTLIFVDRQEKADDLLKDLMRKGYPCMSIHGGKDQIDRDSTIDDFKAGVVPIMIATSVAARGLDVKQLKLVVNFDAPNHLEDYVHRAGRTGRAGNTGTAVTFVTEDQEQYSVGIAKALEQSGQPVPDRLNDMRKSFRDKVKTGKMKDSSGFGGKGLERLDAEREAARMRERKTHKTDGDDEEEKEDKTGDDDIVLKAASTVQSATAAPSAPLFGVPKGIDLDGKITVHRTETAAPGGSGSKNPLEKVTSAIDAINARLNKTGQLRSGVPIDNKGPDAGAFHATLEINDFPQKARWAVTNRTNVAKILEATGTSITTKGSFYPAGKDVQPGGDPKLYILVEGDTEVVVTNAMRELMRLLKEGTMAAADAEGRAPASGRYNVV